MLWPTNPPSVIADVNTLILKRIMLMRQRSGSRWWSLLILAEGRLFSCEMWLSLDLPAWQLRGYLELTNELLPALSYALTEWSGGYVLITAVAPKGQNGQMKVHRWDHLWWMVVRHWDFATSLQSNLTCSHISRLVPECFPTEWSMSLGIFWKYGDAYFGEYYAEQEGSHLIMYQRNNKTWQRWRLRWSPNQTLVWTWLVVMVLN